MTKTTVLAQRSDDQRKPLLYVVATSHLDSQWNWTVQDTIREFVPNTFFENFKRFERYPNYRFNYEGAIHYMWFKEYHPEAWPTLKNYVASGRWQLSGSWINAVDVNIPSPESLMRQALYGNRFFRQEFGKTSHDVYLPDCFGFGFALPSIAAHCGLSGFTTQKLTWGSSYGIPFPIGRWKGVDGSTIVAALNPGDYVTKIRSDISVDPKWSNDLTSIGDRKVGFRLFGTGDIGGAPDEESLGWLEKALANSSGAVEVRNTSADQLSHDLDAEEKALLPEYTGELTMKTHGVGCYTSQAAMKRFNRENELLADAAERASVTARVLAGLPYPGERLREAWIRFLWHQFHDDLTGTSIPQAYQFSWNDELVTANQFAGVLTSSTAAVANLLDTRSSGIPLVVYNRSSEHRRDVVDATIEFGDLAPAAVRVIDGVTGLDVPAQVLDTQSKQAHILFVADVPSVGFKVFEVKAAAAEQSRGSSLQVTESSLENSRYRAKLDHSGDISSVTDKQNQRELLKEPIRLELRNDSSPDKPAWRILWDTVNAKPREYVSSPTFRIVERGPVRATIEVTRHAAGSTFVQRVMLTAGGDRVDVENLVDWRSPNSLLKAAFSFSATSPKATYDLGLGTIERGNNTSEHYEVPAQKWADLTDVRGLFGVAILSDSKYGWDKPADNVLRLTLLHTAKARAYPYQSSNDLGHHRFTFSIAGHAADWRTGRVPQRAAALNQPLLAFQTESHTGKMGRALSLLSVRGSEDQITVQALKKAEDSDEIVLRVQERYGRPGKTLIKFAAPIIAAREINAVEEEVKGKVKVLGDTSLVIELKPYQPRTFALRLRDFSGRPEVRSRVLNLPFNLDGVSTNSDRSDGDFDGKHQTLAAEQFPRELLLNGIPFKFGPGTRSQANVLIPKGEQLQLPSGDTYDRMYLIAAAVDGDQDATFSWRGQEKKILVREWQGPIGQWDSRLKVPRQLREVHVAPMTRGQTWTADAIQEDLVVSYNPATGNVSGIDQIRPGFVKRDEVAYVGTHRHAPDGDQVYIPTYLFVYVIDLPPALQEVQLPSNDKVRIFAITVAHQRYHLWPATRLYAANLAEP